MTGPNHRRSGRSLVLYKGLSTGWTHEFETFDDARIIRDVFSNPRAELRVTWTVTPWRCEGRFAGALFQDHTQNKAVNGRGITSDRGVLELLTTHGTYSQ